ncbi:short-chain dehydrogenase [Subtercola boreus]|uniref:Short-chain dehydrogenase n=1 Tax=Subtercola boreus TaxID=120213 RepID=A0A3E0VAM9_9MICO|nr:SDR family oxidoreductase [Subtercola boreus]RFA06583.1 short-chain dehydrogenase [Subtercola boreus]
MITSLAGRKALVTGAGSGIGKATAALLLSEGADVAALDIDEAGLAELTGRVTSTSGRLISKQVDFLSAESTTAGVNAATAELGGLDILVNNVGAGIGRVFDDIDDEMWMKTLQLNFMSYVRTTRLTLPLLRESSYGSIVNNASDLARQPETVPVDYGASKAAVLALTKSLARAEGPTIRVNAVAPGPIWTPFWSKPGGFADDLAQLHNMEPQAAVEHEMKLRQLPLARLGTPEEVANVIVFLAGDLASFVTGSVWGVDGGSIRSII